MAHIETGNNYPGILGLLYFKESTGQALSHLAQTLLHGPSGLTKGERELVASYVSRLNRCNFCCDSHSAAASHHFGSPELVEAVLGDLESAPISAKMRELLRVAGQVQAGGLAVTRDAVERAKKAGASEEDLHDTVLVAAAFCMYNRYVDGLGTVVAEPHQYPEMGKQLAERGYKYPPLAIRWWVRKLLDRTFGSRLQAKAA